MLSATATVKPRSVGAFIAYVLDEKMERAKREVIACYIADAIMHVCGNTARYAGGVTITKSLRDILHPAPKCDKSVDELVDQVFSKINKEVNN